MSGKIKSALLDEVTSSDSVKRHPIKVSSERNLLLAEDGKRFVELILTQDGQPEISSHVEFVEAYGFSDMELAKLFAERKLFIYLKVAQPGSDNGTMILYPLESLAALNESSSLPYESGCLYTIITRPLRYADALEGLVRSVTGAVSERVLKLNGEGHSDIWSEHNIKEYAVKFMVERKAPDCQRLKDIISRSPTCPSLITEHNVSVWGKGLSFYPGKGIIYSL